MNKVVDTQKFGRYIAKLRKDADMTQSELADRLSLTRQTVSHYEMGDSFPDVSILVLISDIFGISLDELIASGNPTHGNQRSFPILPTAERLRREI